MRGHVAAPTETFLQCNVRKERKRRQNISVSSGCCVPDFGEEREVGEELTERV